MAHLTADAGSRTGLRARIVEALVNRALPDADLLAPDPDDPRILLSDWSHFQGNIDIGVHIAYGPPKFKGVIIRSGQGKNSSYDDVQFRANVEKCEAHNFPWMSYHVLIPNQDTDAQIAHMMDLLEALGGPLPRWIWWDVQVHNNMSKRHISNATIRCVQRTKNLSHIGSGVYSAKWFTNGYMETQDWYSEIEWWIAQWLWPYQEAEAPWPSLLPERVDISQVMIHQTTSGGDGRLVGMEEERIDFDRWMWSDTRFNEIMGVETPPPPPAPIKELNVGLASIKADAETIRREAERLQNIVDVLEA